MLCYIIYCLRSLSSILPSVVLRFLVKKTWLLLVGSSASSTMMKPSCASSTASSNTVKFTVWLVGPPGRNTIPLDVLSKSLLPPNSSKRECKEEKDSHRNKINTIMLTYIQQDQDGYHETYQVVENLNQFGLLVLCTEHRSMESAWGEYPPSWQISVELPPRLLNWHPLLLHIRFHWTEIELLHVYIGGKQNRWLNRY